MEPMLPSNVAVRLLDVGIAYNGIDAVKGVNMTLLCDKITCFMGGSGCGKSSIVRAINGMHLLYPSEVAVTGNVRVQYKLPSENGTNIYETLDVRRGVSEERLRSKVGYVQQQSGMLPKTIYENVAYGLRLAGIRDKAILDGIVETSLRRAALWEHVSNRLDEKARRLSIGQQQRLAIARSIAMNPSILLLDEPCSALDPKTRYEIEDLIKELSNSMSIILVTHEVEEAQYLADEIAFFYTVSDEESETGRGYGYLLEFGSKKDIFENPKNQQTYDFIHGRIG